MDIDTKLSVEGSNPLVAISVAIGLAIVMVVVTFTVFIQSGAYTTVEQIKAGTKFARSIQMNGYDTKSPIKAADIAKYEQSLNQRLDSYSDTSDFSPSEISDAKLGLN